MRKPGSEGPLARQRGTGKGEETGGASAKGLGLTSLSPSPRDAGTTGRAGRKRGDEGEEQEEEPEEEEEQVVVREGLEEEEEEDEDEERGEGWREARASSLPCLLISAAPSLPSVSSFASLPGVRPAKASLPLCCWPSSEATPVLVLSTVVPSTTAVPAGGTAQAAMERCCRWSRAFTTAPFMLRWGCSVWEIMRVLVRSHCGTTAACCLFVAWIGESFLCPCLCGHMRG